MAIEERLIDGRMVTGTPDDFECLKMQRKLTDVINGLTSQVRAMEQAGKIDNGFRTILGFTLRDLSRELERARQVVDTQRVTYGESDGPADR